MNPVSQRFTFHPHERRTISLRLQGALHEAGYLSTRATDDARAAHVRDVRRADKATKLEFALDHELDEQVAPDNGDRIQRATGALAALRTLHVSREALSEFVAEARAIADVLHEPTEDGRTAERLERVTLRRATESSPLERGYAFLAEFGRMDAHAQRRARLTEHASAQPPSAVVEEVRSLARDAPALAVRETVRDVLPAAQAIAHGPARLQALLALTRLLGGEVDHAALEPVRTAVGEIDADAFLKHEDEMEAAFGEEFGAARSAESDEHAHALSFVLGELEDEETCELWQTQIASLFDLRLPAEHGANTSATTSSV